MTPTETASAAPAATSTTRARAPRGDRQLLDAADAARAALLESQPESSVGEHLGTVVEADRLVTHLFAVTEPGYPGWQWAVTVTRAARQSDITVDEVVMVAGADSVVAPAWVPWKDRVDPTDLGPGDLVPIPDDDPRLVPGYLVGDEALDQASSRDEREVIREVGLGREVVLSVAGRDQAAERWHAGVNGPETAIAREAPAHCLTCGFMLRLRGPLSMEFGVCANVSSPSDGQVVAYDHGCGAHSDVRGEPLQHVATTAPYHDTLTFDTWSDAELEIIR